MSAEHLFHYDPCPPEWWRSGRFFLLAIAIHAVLLAWPVSLREPLPARPLTVRLSDSPVPAKVLPPAVPAVKPARPHASPTASTPQPRPVLAVKAESPAAVISPPAQPPALAVAAVAAVEPARAPAAAVTASAPAPLVAARFDAAYLHNPEPRYPPLSRRLGEEGRVLLKVRVSTAGQPLAVELEKSSNFERLDEAARQVVQRWRFVPARRGDEAVEASVIVPLVFHLED
ncbi:MAG: energy transducer TonB [Bacteroidota bacterium]